MGTVVSIIIPTYKRPALLKRAICSAMNQVYKLWEVIVVDDCSGDHTETVVMQFNDDRIRYVRMEKNGGANAARNHGLSLAKGDYIQFLDDDNELHPNKLQDQLHFFKKLPNQVGVVFCGLSYVTGDGQTKNWVPKKSRVTYRDILRGDSLDMGMALIKKQYLDKVGGFDESLPSIHDWELWIRISKVCECRTLPQILFYYHVHDLGQISNEIDKTIKGREILLEINEKDIKSDRVAYCYHLYRLGVLYYLKGAKSKGIGLIFKSMYVFPLYWKQYAVLLLSLVDIVFPNTLLKLVTYNFHGQNRLYS